MQERVIARRLKALKVKVVELQYLDAKVLLCAVIFAIIP